jgi:RsiW-degrading membrane proteinase PrsW (M82 family)
MMMLGFFLVVIDITLLVLMSMFAYTNAGTFSGWCMLIAAVAWGILVGNALKNSFFRA